MKRKKRTQETRLTTALSLWFDKPVSKLPDHLRQRVERSFLPSWDFLTPTQRRIVARQIDAQNPNLLDKAEKQAAERAFKDGYKSLSVPERNTRNARRPRYSRRKVSDDDIERVKAQLDAEGISPHKQQAKARERLEVRISKEGLRKRWNRLFGKAT